MKPGVKIKAIVAAALIAGALLIAAYLGGVFQRDLFSQLEAEKRPRQARAKLEKMTAQNPDDMRAQGWLLRLELEDGDLQKAEQRLGLLLVKTPDHYFTQSGACRLYLKKNMNAQALRFCRRAHELSEGDAREANHYGVALVRARRFYDAEKIFKEALEAHPDDFMLLVNLGHASLGLNKNDQAIVSLEKACSLFPLDITCRRNLAQAYYQAKRNAEAVAELKELIKLAPDDMTTYYNLVIILALELDKPEEARTYLRQAIEKGLEDQLAQNLVTVVESVEQAGKASEAPDESGDPQPPSPEQAE